MKPLCRGPRLSPDRMSRRNRKIIRALERYKKKPDKKSLRRLSELIYPIAVDAISTYKGDMAWDILHSVMEEVMRKKNFLKYDPSKGTPDQFFYRCFRNLAVNYYHVYRRDVDRNVFFSDIRSGDHGPLEVSDESRAVLGVEDDSYDNVSGLLDDRGMNELAEEVLSEVKRLCDIRFSGDMKDMVLMAARDIVIYGLPVNSSATSNALFYVWGLSYATAKHVIDVALSLIREVMIRLGIKKPDELLLRKLSDVLSSKDSLFVNFCGMLGWKAASTMVSVFGGSSIRVPTEGQVREVVMQGEIYSRLSEVKGKRSRMKEARSLAKRYSVDVDEVMKTYRKVRRMWRRAEKMTKEKA